VTSLHFIYCYRNSVRLCVRPSVPLVINARRGSACSASHTTERFYSFDDRVRGLPPTKELIRGTSLSKAIIRSIWRDWQLGNGTRHICIIR